MITKKNLLTCFCGLFLLVVLVSCNRSEKQTNNHDQFKVSVDAFADLEILRYQVPGWEQLTLEHKTFAYYLYQAALSGRDIIYDQRGKYNLAIRKTLEAIWHNPTIKKSGDEWEKFKRYSGQFWFSNGNHHHYSNDKFVPACSFEYFTELVRACDVKSLPLSSGETVASFLAHMKQVMFDPAFEAKMVNLTEGIDHVAQSSNNFYESVTQAEVEEFYNTFPHTGQDPEWGLNSKVIKESGKLVERVWKVGGMYSAAIEKMVYWIEKAIPLAENDQQRKALSLLVDYYKTGDLRKWDEYNIAWVQDTTATIDFTNGFIEVYNDAIGIKGSYEAVLSLKDLESTKRIKAIADQAQWFEDNSPLIVAHKKKR